MTHRRIHRDVPTNDTADRRIPRAARMIDGANQALGRADEVIASLQPTNDRAKPTKNAWATCSLRRKGFASTHPRKLR